MISKNISPGGRGVRFVLPLLALFFFTGCAIHSGGQLEVDRSGPELTQSDWSDKRLWVRTFEHKAVSDVSSVYATGSGGTVSGLGVTRTTYSAPPRYLISAIEDAGIFKSVTPTIQMGSEPDLILEGSVTVECETPWWTWAQLVDLWIHAWFFPTLGRNWETVGEFSLYDKEHVLIHRWKFRLKDEYVSSIWWMFSHGGADDKGFDVECQKEALCTAVKKIFSQGPSYGIATLPRDRAPDRAERGEPTD